MLLRFLVNMINMDTEIVLSCEAYGTRSTAKSCSNADVAFGVPSQISKFNKYFLTLFALMKFSFSLISYLLAAARESNDTIIIQCLS